MKKAQAALFDLHFLAAEILQPPMHWRPLPPELCDQAIEVDGDGPPDAPALPDHVG